jgi:oligopeptidase B
VLVIRTNADGAEDFKIVTAPPDAPGRENWRELVPHTRGRQIVSMAAFAGHLVRVERENALPRIIVRRKSDGTEHAIAFSEEAYALDFVVPFEFDTRLLRFQYSSPATPQQTFDYDMETRERVLRRRQVIPSGHEPSNYVVRRLHATSHDNEQIPITVLHRKDLKLDGSAALFIDGYGAYGSVFDAQFDANLISLVDRGFVYAIAHIRGAPEKGERWREAGRRARKMNSFRDFIAVAERLHKSGYGSPLRTVAHGRSAGGLLVAAVANMRPDLFGAIVAGVPFVDAINTLLDDTLPLTVNDFQEWGNPAESLDTYRTIAAYSPYDNVAAKAYPHMFVTAGVSDPRVQYWEPLKWVARLRAVKTNDARIVLTTRLTAGHFGPAGRFEALDEKADTFAFVIGTLGLR